MLFGGLDMGAVATKAVIIDENSSILSSNVIRTGSNSKLSGKTALEEAGKKIHKDINDLDYIVATGYGRENAPFAEKYPTEITCHAKGAFFLYPSARTVIDIGGQDSKAIHLDNQGNITDFVMNDKCAAGTGRFLEVMAGVLDVSIKELGRLSLESKNKVEISSMCTVFAESEVISLIAQGCSKEDIAMGIHNSIADRVVGLASKVKICNDVALTGGVINNIGVVHALSKRLGIDVKVSDNPQLTGALGAALIAKESAAYSTKNK